MKRITRAASILAFAAFLGVTSPVVAQSGGNETSTSQTAGDNDDNGKWGLLGLAGLLGLLGLKKKDRDNHRTTTNR